MGADRELHYWDPHTEKRQPHAEISTIDRWSIDTSMVPQEPHTLPVNTFDTVGQAVSFPGVEDPNGLLASGSSDKKIWLQGFPALRPLFQIQEQGEVWAVALSPDGYILASGGDFAGIHLWDLRTISPTEGTIELKSILGASTGRVEGLAFSPDGQTLAVATGRSDGEAIHLWDLRTEQRIETLTAVGVKIRSIAFSPDGKIIAGGAYHTRGGRNVLLWKQEPLSPAKIPHSIELTGPQVVRALNKDFTFTVTVKNVYGQGIDKIRYTIRINP
jgi:WD40 repeat protein